VLKDWLNTNKRVRDNRLTSHLRTFATSVMDDGHADVTKKSKLCLLADFGLWLGRRGLSVAKVDEKLVEAFVKRKKRVRRGDLRTLQQFLDHLRKGHIVPDRKLVSDKSPWANILSRYEKHLRSERGLVTVTIINYQPFVRKFLIGRPLLPR
jgi:integrase/recombinase XerD